MRKPSFTWTVMSSPTAGQPHRVLALSVEIGVGVKIKGATPAQLLSLNLEPPKPANEALVASLRGRIYMSVKGQPDCPFQTIDETGSAPPGSLRAEVTVTDYFDPSAGITGVVKDILLPGRGFSPSPKRHIRLEVRVTDAGSGAVLAEGHTSRHGEPGADMDFLEGFAGDDVATALVEMERLGWASGPLQEGRELASRKLGLGCGAFFAFQFALFGLIFLTMADAAAAGIVAAVFGFLAWLCFRKALKIKPSPGAKALVSSYAPKTGSPRP